MVIDIDVKLQIQLISCIKETTRQPCLLRQTLVKLGRKFMQKNKE